MDEQQIAQTLQQKVARPAEATPIAPQELAPVGQAEQAMPLELDEMTVYKIHEFFGEKYRSTDETSIQQSKYIYEKLSEIMGEQDYGLIVEKARELERLIGTTNSQRRMYKLYQWLKLDSMRRSTEAQMNALRG